MDPREAALTLLRATVARLADELRRIDCGWVARSQSLELVWALNHVRLERPTPYADATALVAEHLAGLPFEHIVIEDKVGEALEAEFLGDGWKVERDVVMALAREPDRVVDTSAAVELPRRDALRLMADWLEAEMTLSAEALQQLLRATSLEGEIWADRRLGALGEDGEAVAMTKLRGDGTTAWVEDVYVSPAARGRGLGRMLVTRAIELAREADPRVVFIVANDDGWPKTLYAKLGFEPVGQLRSFHRGPR
jgi:GNAT superfamily N-acetyltransferase